VRKWKFPRRLKLGKDELRQLPTYTGCLRPCCFIDESGGPLPVVLRCGIVYFNKSLQQERLLSCKCVSLLRQFRASIVFGTGIELKNTEKATSMLRISGPISLSNTPYDCGCQNLARHLARHGAKSNANSRIQSAPASMEFGFKQKSSRKEIIKFRPLTTANEGERRRKVDQFFTDSGQRKWVSRCNPLSESGALMTLHRYIVARPPSAV
jgi:hypothetical protein